LEHLEHENNTYQTGGVLAGLDVSVGDSVTAGQVLGRLEENALRFPFSWSGVNAG